MGNFINLKSFLNFLNRNKLYTAINILGFALSLMFVILLTVYAQKEASVDDFQVNKERIFLFSNEESASTAYPVGQMLKDRYPEIESFTFLTNTREQVSVNNNKKDCRILKADSSFFHIFSYRLTQGSREQALVPVNNIAVSEQFARETFGDASPIGQVIMYYEIPLTVAAVFADFGNSTIQSPDLIMRIEYTNPQMRETTNSASWELWILTHQNTDLTRKIPEMLEFLKENYWIYQDKLHSEIRLPSLKEAYFSEATGGQISRHLGDRKQLVLLSSVGLLILLFAIINYVNLSVAQAGMRAKEMATRRLLGGTRAQLFGRLIIESILLCGVSFIAGLFLAEVAEPVFNRLVMTDISIQDSFSGSNLLLALSAIIGLGIIAGLIPALVISNHQPIEVVRGTFRRKTKMVYSKVLITFLYLITIVLIGCTLTMIKQVDHMVKADMGYATDQLFILKNRGLSASSSRAFQNEIAVIPGVEAVSLCRGTPLDGGNNNTDLHSYPETMSYQVFHGDSLYFKIMKFEILRDNHIPDANAAWVNESALKALNMKDDATEFLYYNEPTKIAGIIKDFYFEDLTHPVGPALIFNYQPDERPWSILIKMSGEDLPHILKQFETTYKKITGNNAFQGEFASRIIQNWYTSQQNLSQIIGYLAVITALIATLGILAMATYFIRQRALEIAVRKVYGSTKNEILQRLILNFLRLVIVAFVVAVPAIWFIMSDWLSDYPYRISLSWTIFAISGLATLTIAFLAIFWQSNKASNINPTDTLQK